MTDLSERYSGTPKRRGKLSSVTLGIIFGAILTIGVVGVWGLWMAGPDGAAATIEGQTVRFSPVDDASVTIDYRVSVAPGTPLVCALEAQDDLHAVVGWKIVEIPPSSEYTRVLSDEVATLGTASTILVKSCWVPTANNS